jgi:hypothetical protein
MLRKEQNELLAQTGPGTPIDRLFRWSWIRAPLVDELPENECPPVRARFSSSGCSRSVTPMVDGGGADDRIERFVKRGRDSG